MVYAPGTRLKSRRSMRRPDAASDGLAGWLLQALVLAWLVPVLIIAACAAALPLAQGSLAQPETRVHSADPGPGPRDVASSRPTVAPLLPRKGASRAVAAAADRPSDLSRLSAGAVLVPIAGIAARTRFRALPAGEPCRHCAAPWRHYDAQAPPPFRS